MVRVHDLHEALDALGDAGVATLAFKGPVLDADLRGDPWRRECADLDFLVLRRERAAALAALGRAAWIPAVEVHPRSWPALERTGCEVPLVRPGRSTLDLHWDLAPRWFSWRPDPEGLFARARAVDVAGRPVPTLSRGDALLHLCVHGCRSDWARPVWVEDVALALPRLCAADAATALAGARRTGALRMLAAGIALAERIHGARVPGALRAAVDGDPGAASLADLHADAIAGRARIPAGAAGRLALRLRSRERARDRARMLAGLLGTPSLEECRRPLAPAPARWAARIARGIAAARREA